MKNSLLAVAALVIWNSTAVAYWPTTPVTRQEAEREKLPLSVKIIPLGDGTVDVQYEVTPTGPFAHLGHAEILVSDGDQPAFRFPIAPAVDSEGISGPVKGRFQVQQKMLNRCRLRLDCPIERLSMSGQTFSIDLASYFVDNGGAQVKGEPLGEAASHQARSVGANIWHAEKGKLPNEPAPRFFILAKVAKDHIELQDVVSTSNVFQPSVISLRVPLNNIQIYSPSGKDISAEALKAKEGAVVLVAVDQNKVDPSYLKVLKEDTLIIVGVYGPAEPTPLLR